MFSCLFSLLSPRRLLGDLGLMVGDSAFDSHCKECKIPEDVIQVLQSHDFDIQSCSFIALALSDI